MADFSTPTGTITLPDGLSSELEQDLLRKVIQGQSAISARALTRESAIELGEARQRSATAQAEEQLGAPLARTEQGRLAEFDEPGLRFDLARSNLLQEKLDKIKASMPDIEVKPFDLPDGTQSLALRRPGEEAFTLLDSGEVTTLSDIADIGGIAVSAETAATVIGAIRTRGASLIMRMIGTGLGGSLGRALDIGTEAARGFEDDPLVDVFGDIAIAGVLGAGGEALFALPRRGARGAIGRGTITLSPEELAAERTAREVGIPGLTPGQANPALQRIEQQSAATSKAVPQFRASQARAALESLKSMAGKIGNIKNLTDEALEKVVETMRRDVFNIVTDVGKTTPEVMGRALKKARTESVRVAKNFLKRRYDKALAAGEDAGFDLTPAHERAAIIKKGVKGKRTIEFQAVDDQGKPLFDAKGKPVLETKEVAVQLRRLDSELSSVVDDILKLDADVMAFEGSSAFEQMKTLRTRLFDLKNATVQGKETIQNRFAGQLWSDLTQIMENPIGGSPEFVRLLRSANRGNVTFERTLEIVDLKRIAAETEPGQLGPLLFQPFKSKTLRILKRVISKEKFAQFKDGVSNMLLRDPLNINRTLDQFLRDPSSLRAVFSEAEEGILRVVGRRFERFTSNPIVDMLKKQTALKEKFQTLFAKGSAGDLAQIIEKSGGKNSKVGRALAAGLIENIADTATRVAKGKDVLNFGTFISEVGRLERKGVLDAVLQPSQIKALKDKQFLSSFLDVPADVGASMRGASIASKATAFLEFPVRPIASIKETFSGIVDLSRNAIVGRIFTSETGRRFIVGAGGLQPDLTGLRALSAVLAEILGDLERQAGADLTETGETLTGDKPPRRRAVAKVGRRPQIELSESQFEELRARVFEDARVTRRRPAAAGL